MMQRKRSAKAGQARETRTAAADRPSVIDEATWDGFPEDVKRYLAYLRRYQDDPRVVADGIYKIIELPEESYRLAGIQRELANIWHLIPVEVRESVAGAFPGSKAIWAALADALIVANANATAPAKSVHRRREQWVAEAMMLVQEHPDWSDAKVAREVGVSPSTLSRCDEYKRLARMCRGDRRDLPTGHVVTDPVTGERLGVEARCRNAERNA